MQTILPLALVCQELEAENALALRRAKEGRDPFADTVARVWSALKV